MQFKLIQKLSKGKLLALVGLFLPYFVIISIAIAVRFLPFETAEEKWANAGDIIFWLRDLSAIVASIFLAFYAALYLALGMTWLRRLLVFVAAFIIVCPLH